MAKANLKNRNETKSDIFPWGIARSETISFSKFLSFMTKVNPNNENEIKSDILSWFIFKSDIIFHWSHNTKIFQ